jgi:hypothetical protein
MPAVEIKIGGAEYVFRWLRYDLRVPGRLSEAVSDGIDGLDSLGIGNIYFGGADAHNRA